MLLSKLTSLNAVQIEISFAAAYDFNQYSFNQYVPRLAPPCPEKKIASPSIPDVHTAHSPGMSRETFEKTGKAQRCLREESYGLVEASPKPRSEGRHPKNLCVSSLSLHVLLLICFGCSLRKLHIFQQPGHCTIPCDCCFSIKDLQILPLTINGSHPRENTLSFGHCPNYPSLARYPFWATCLLLILPET